MAYENTNRGSIWKNDRKKEDWQPDFTGSINVDGFEFFLDGWLRKEDANPRAPAMSFRVKLKDKQPTADNGATGKPSRTPSQQSIDAQAPPAKTAPPADFDDDIPF